MLTHNRWKCPIGRLPGSKCTHAWQTLINFITCIKPIEWYKYTVLNIRNWYRKKINNIEKVVLFIDAQYIYCIYKLKSSLNFDILAPWCGGKSFLIYNWYNFITVHFITVRLSIPKSHPHPPMKCFLHLKLWLEKNYLLIFLTILFQIIAFDELKTDYKNPIDQCNSLNPVSTF